MVCPTSRMGGLAPLLMILSSAFTSAFNSISVCGEEKCIAVVSDGLLPNGTVLSPGTVGAKETYTVSDCTCGSNHRCFRRCCPVGSSVDLENGRCEYYAEEDGSGINVDRVQPNASATQEIHGSCHENCPTGLGFSVVKLEELRSPKGAECFIGENKSCEKISCMDYNSLADEFTVAVCEGSKNGTKMIVAWKGYQYPSPVMPVLIGVMLIISFLSLTVCFMVYCYFSELRNLHGKCLLCHMGSLIVYYVVITVRRFRSGSMRANGLSCFALDTFRYCFYLASFSWLNVTCFDISLSFLFFKPNHGRFRRSERTKFALYSMYAWLTPVVSFCISLVIDLDADGLDLSAINIPNWCKEKRLSSAMYRYIPMCLFMAFSAVLFVATATKIHKINKSTSILREGETARQSTHEKNRKKRFQLYAKLLVVMGFSSWIMEPTLWAVREWVLANRTDFRSTVWFAMLVVRNLNGLYISAVFLCNKKVRRLATKAVGRTPETSSSSQSRTREMVDINHRRPSGSTIDSLQSCSTNQDAIS